MVDRRRRPPGGSPRALALALATLWTALGPAAAPAPAQAGGRSVPLASAAELGTFNVGAARASYAPAQDPDAGRVLRLQYAMPAGTAVGVWARAFPGGLGPGNVDVARLSARGEGPEPARSVAVSMEVKGSSGTQRIPLDLRPGWSTAEEAVDWGRVGTLKEVVVNVNRVGDGAGTTSGAIDLDVRFEALSWARRLSTLPASRAAAVLLVALLGAGAVALSGMGGGGSNVQAVQCRVHAGVHPAELQSAAVRGFRNWGVGAPGGMGAAAGRGARPAEGAPAGGPGYCQPAGVLPLRDPARGRGDHPHRVGGEPYRSPHSVPPRDLLDRGSWQHY